MGKVEKSRSMGCVTDAAGLCDKIRDQPGTSLSKSAALGISPQYLCDILQGRRDISSTVADRLGYERIVLFRAKVGDGEG